MQLDDKENIASTEVSLDSIFSMGSPPPSVGVKKNLAFRTLDSSSHNIDTPPRSVSLSEVDSPLCGSNKYTHRFRPKPKVRRTLSMFQKPDEFLDTEMEEAEDCTPPQVLPCRDPKTDECQILPCFGVKEDMLKRIDDKTVFAFPSTRGVNKSCLAFWTDTMRICAMSI
jgi:hypothetical protein